MKPGNTPYPSLAVRIGIDSGIHRLVAPPSPNGVAPTGILEFLLGAATAGGAPERAARITALALQAGTAPTYAQPSVWGGVSDGCILGNAGGYYLAGNTTDGAITTQDIWIKIKSHVVASVVLAAKRTTGVGYVVGFDATPALYCTIQDATGAVTVTSAALTAGTFVSADLAINRDDATMGGRWFINDAASGTLVDCTARVLTIDAAVALALLANSAGSSPMSTWLHFVGVYWHADWFRAGATGAADVLAEHKSQRAMVYGTRPSISIAAATGLAAGGNAGVVYQERVVSGSPSLTYMGIGAPRFVQRLDSTGRSFTGARVEPGETTLLAGNNLGAWIKSANVTRTVNTTDTPAPDGTYTATKLVGLGMGSTEYLYSQLGGQVANTRFEYGCWLKRISASGNFQVRETTTAYGYTDVNLATIGAGWVRVGKGYVGTHAGNAKVTAGGAAGISLTSSDAGTVDVYVWNPNIAYQTDPLGSDILGAAVRAADTPHRYSGAAHFGAASGSLFCRFLSRVFTPAANRHLLAMYLTGSAATDFLTVALEAASGHLIVTSAASGGSAGSIELATNFCNDLIHELVVTWEKNRLVAWVDGVQSSVDTACDFAAMDILDIGSDNAAALQAGLSLVGNVQIVPYAVPGPIPCPGGFVYST